MDLDLVIRARAGDHDAFASLVGATIARSDAVARLILRDPDLAKDAVQEALVRSWRDLPTLRDPARYESWSYRILVNACRDEIRRNRRATIALDLDPSFDLPSTSVDVQSMTADREQLELGFRRLEPDQRAIVVLRHYLDLSMPEVARVLGIPLGTAKSRLHRATRDLRAALEADLRVGVELSKGGQA